MFRLSCGLLLAVLSLPALPAQSALLGRKPAVSLGVSLEVERYRQELGLTRESGEAEASLLSPLVEELRELLGPRLSFLKLVSKPASYRLQLRLLPARKERVGVICLPTRLLWSLESAMGQPLGETLAISFRAGADYLAPTGSRAAFAREVRERVDSGLSLKTGDGIAKLVRRCLRPIRFSLNLRQVLPAASGRGHQVELRALPRVLGFDPWSSVLRLQARVDLHGDLREVKDVELLTVGIRWADRSARKHSHDGKGVLLELDPGVGGLESRSRFQIRGVYLHEWCPWERALRLSESGEGGL